MNLRFDHLGLLSDSHTKNQEIADFFAGVLGLEVSGDAGEGYAEVKAGAMTIARPSQSTSRGRATLGSATRGQL
ncbi:hypothetical protein [Kribbella sp. HUAS MG21]|jgi:hypothetical protein|uniref:VOC domain-containing protein n=1 Tax=Kribbella sp. HUAS MG21 TaxID=3160966 RepID=A0AAU7TBK6_9ACTN